MAVHGINKLGTKQVTVPAPKVADYSAHLSDAPALQSAPVIATTTKQVKKDGVDPNPVITQETVHPGLFTTNGMRVGVTLGRTIATAPYENVKIDINLIIPCDPHSLNEAYEWGTDWISDRITKAEKEAKGIA